MRRNELDGLARSPVDYLVALWRALRGIDVMLGGANRWTSIDLAISQLKVMMGAVAFVLLSA
jgi:hypothetical protein